MVLYKDQYLIMVLYLLNGIEKGPLVHESEFRNDHTGEIKGLFGLKVTQNSVLFSRFSLLNLSFHNSHLISLLSPYSIILLFGSCS